MKYINNESIKNNYVNMTSGEKCAVLGTVASLYLITLFTVVKNKYSLKIGTFSIE